MIVGVTARNVWKRFPGVQAQGRRNHCAARASGRSGREERSWQKRSCKHPLPDFTFRIGPKSW